jgi:two-component system, NtrC family, sensor kinase
MEGMRRSRAESHLAIRLSVSVVLMVVGALLLANSTLEGVDPTVRHQMLWRYLLAAFAGGVLLAGILDFLVTRPTTVILKQVRAAANNDWRTPIDVPKNRGEFTELAVALEELRSTVTRHTSNLAKLNQELEARVATRTLQLEKAQNQLIASEKLAALGRLAAGIAHEVNNPNGVILSRASYLLSIADEEGLDPDIIDDIEVIELQSRRVSSVASELLSLRSDRQIEIEQVNLEEVVKLTVRLMRTLAEENGVSVTYSSQSPAYARGANQEIEQVCLNILKNAIHSGATEVTAISSMGSIAITDNGEGIPPDAIEKIFEPFYTTKGVGKGTGLGLSVSHDIVSALGGRIEVSSANKGETTFTIHLPVD